MKPVIRIAFADTYENAELFWLWVLDQKYQVCLDPDNPQLLIFGDGNFGQQHRSDKYKHVPKMFFTGENVRWPIHEARWSCDFDFDYNVPLAFNRYQYRLPLYVLEMFAYQKDHGYTFDYLYHSKPFVDKASFYHELESKEGFCSFVQSNPNVPFRNQFFHWLNALKPIASGGPLFNNIGYVVNRPGGHLDKHDFIRKYKFNLAFENGSHDGYVTEKLLNAFYANTIPIYWGSPTVAKDFNTEAFINVHDYISGDRLNTDALWDKIKEIDQSDEKYLDMLSKPAFNGDNGNQYTDISRLLDWFDANIYKELK